MARNSKFPGNSIPKPIERSNRMGAIEAEYRNLGTFRPKKNLGSRMKNTLFKGNRPSLRVSGWNST